MRIPFPPELEVWRDLTGPMATEPGKPYGAFHVDALYVMASNASRESAWWEHVSVSRPDRTPTWTEMCLVKKLFWTPEETVIQFHPTQSRYVNCHPHCLHLWRPTRHKDKLPLPPSHLVGPQSWTRP